MQHHLFTTILAIFLMAGNMNAIAQNKADKKRIYQTQRLDQPPDINGILDDSCWKLGDWSLNYVQQQPYERKTPSQNTSFKILYDDDNIYVAIRAFETEPERIDRQLARRDAFSGDIVGINFDSYFDHRTGFEFNLTAAGSKIDLVLLNDGWDTSWNAVWDGKVAMEDSAWTAEIKIPLSQLRYGNKKEHIWGLHAWRWINRHQEEDQWNLIPRDSPGYVYSFGELHGIQDLKPFRRIEIQPYSVGKVRATPQDNENPFINQYEKNLAFGLDGKFGLSSDFTMDLTVNPDFGQVEADPSEMNLSAFETYFPEKRPFFLEGRNILDYELGGDLLFYSRRIGHAPSYSPSLEENEYARNEENSTILNAMKITGKTPSGLSVGIVQSITAKEQVEIATPGNRYKETSEPYSNYFVSRVEKDYDNGNTILGGMFTATNRKIDEVHLNNIPKAAYSGGFDFLHHFMDKTYYFELQAAASHLRGDAEAIRSIQESSARYFQRPDARHVRLDTTRKEISGHGGRIKFGKNSNGPWRFSQTLNWRSPGLELNDLGYMQTADYLAHENYVAYVITTPFSIFRGMDISLDNDNTWDYSGQYLDSDLNAYCGMTFTNKWYTSIGAQRNFTQLDTRRLRGGPAIYYDGKWYINGYLQSDPSRKITGSVYLTRHIYDDHLSHALYAGANLSIEALQSLSFNVNIDYGHNQNAWQYVATESIRDQDEYFLGLIDQKNLGLTFRIELGITPDLTIQYYGSPFVSAGTYSEYKRVTNPKADQWQNRVYQISENEMQLDTENDEYRIEEYTGLNYTLENPDFNFREFRSNLVIRWEYSLGSTVYLVWTQGRNGYRENGHFSWQDDMDNLFNRQSNNVFLVKINRWLSL